MFKFQAAGREWHWPKLTTAKLSVLRDECGLDLRGLLRKDSADAALALADDERLIKAFVRVAGDQVEAAGFDFPKLAEAWDQDANVVCREALVECFFTHSQGPKKAAAMMERMRAEGL